MPNPIDEKLKVLKARNKLVLASEVAPPDKLKKGKPENLKARTLSVKDTNTAVPENPVRETTYAPLSPEEAHQAEPGAGIPDDHNRIVIKYEDGFYLPVKERLLEMKKENPVYTLITNYDYQSANGLMMVKAVLTIFKFGQECKYDGIAWAFIEKNANTRKVAGELQTWAWGRALAAAGYGIELNLASGDEIIQVGKDKAGEAPKELTVSETLRQNTKDKLDSKKR